MTAMTARILAGTALCCLLGAGPALAGKPTPPPIFSGFLCQIDLAENGIPLPPELESRSTLTTGDTTKVCANITPGGNIIMTCKSQIPGWTSPALVKTGVPCLVSGEQCGAAGGFAANLSILVIDAKGRTTLLCHAKPTPPPSPT